MWNNSISKCQCLRKTLLSPSLLSSRLTKIIWMNSQIFQLNLCTVELYSLVLFSLQPKDKHNLHYKTKYEKIIKSNYVFEFEEELDGRSPTTWAIPGLDIPLGFLYKDCPIFWPPWLLSTQQWCLFLPKLISLTILLEWMTLLYR